MGIIIKQSIKGSIWSYLGLIVGYINLGIIMPNFFEPEQIGLVQLFAAISLIFANLSTLGFTSVINRSFPIFRNKASGHNGFLFLALTTGLLGILISFIAFMFLKPYIIETNIERSPLFVEYISFLMPLVIFRVLFRLLDSYNKVLYDAVTGTFLSEFAHKALNLLLIIFFAFGWINFRQFFFGYILSLSMPAFPLVIILLKRGEFSLKPNFKFLNPKLKQELVTVAAFGLIISFDGIFITNVDKIMVNHYLSLEETGIFGVCSLFATLILIPFKAIDKISSGIIAESWNKNNLTHIQEVYTKSSINQLVIGTLIFIGIWVNIHNILHILPKEYSSGANVIIIYALGMLVNSSSGVSGTIIGTSAYYKFGTVILFCSIVLLILLSMVFIPIWGITGAALASALTYSIRSFIRILFLRLKFKLFCYNKQTLLIVSISLLVLLFNQLIPVNHSFILDIIIRSALASVVYGCLIYFLNISPEVNQLVKKTIYFLKTGTKT